MLGVRERSDGGGLLSEPVGTGGGAIADCGFLAPAAAAIRCVWSGGRGGWAAEDLCMLPELAGRRGALMLAPSATCGVSEALLGLSGLRGVPSSMLTAGIVNGVLRRIILSISSEDTMVCVPISEVGEMLSRFRQQRRVTRRELSSRGKEGSTRTDTVGARDAVLRVIGESFLIIYEEHVISLQAIPRRGEQTFIHHGLPLLRANSGERECIPLSLNLLVQLWHARSAWLSSGEEAMIGSDDMDLKGDMVKVGISFASGAGATGSVCEAGPVEIEKTSGSFASTTGATGSAQQALSHSKRLDLMTREGCHGKFLGLLDRFDSGHWLATGSPWTQTLPLAAWGSRTLMQARFQQIDQAC
ncbi:hypothetical protein KCU61_g61, partial [Aureobasidium melanogenum]